MRAKSDYHNLLIWHKGKEFILLIYKKTENFPRSEIFGLQLQLRRAAVSFLLNLVEGQRRNFYQKDFLRFLEISDSSLVEVEACLEIVLNLGYISETVYFELEERRKELARMLFSLMKTIEKDL